jgi:hypothetical protein
MPSRNAPALELTGTHDILEEEVTRYLLHAIRPSQDKEPDLTPGTERNVLGSLFDAITHRRFCALSRSRVRSYLEVFVANFGHPFRRGESLEFWLDIGPGYHASLRPGTLPLVFEIGLGEYLMLTQVSAFIRSVASLYSPGIRFRLVVDNLCGLATNDVSIERTAGYCARLRQLIDEMGLAKHVQLFVESEEFALSEYYALLRDVEDQPPMVQISEAEIDNVARFLGRQCSQAEAVERIRLYQRTGAVTEQLLSGVVRGVRLTQRATPQTLGFRSFPGGDARIQCGQVALSRNSDRSIGSVLLTTRNIDFYTCATLHCASALPSAIKHILIASRRA